VAQQVHIALYVAVFTFISVSIAAYAASTHSECIFTVLVGAFQVSAHPTHAFPARPFVDSELPTGLFGVNVTILSGYKENWLLFLHMSIRRHVFARDGKVSASKCGATLLTIALASSNTAKRFSLLSKHEGMSVVNSGLTVRASGQVKNWGTIRLDFPQMRTGVHYCEVRFRFVTHYLNVESDQTGFRRLEGIVFQIAATRISSRAMAHTSRFFFSVCCSRSCQYENFNGFGLCRLQTVLTDCCLLPFRAVHHRRVSRPLFGKHLEACHRCYQRCVVSFLVNDAAEKKPAAHQSSDTVGSV
jgi:hypothetical protein